MSDPGSPSKPPGPGDPGFLDWVRTHSGLTIDAEGVFRYEGAPVEHPRVVRLFKQGLGRAADGRVTLTVGRTWCFVDVVGPLFVVTRAWVDGARLVLALDDGTEQAVAAGDAIAIGPDGVLQARVRDGAEWARFSVEAQQMVAPLLDETDDGFVLRSGADVWRVVEGE